MEAITPTKSRPTQEKVPSKNGDSGGKNSRSNKNHTVLSKIEDIKFPLEKYLTANSDQEEDLILETFSQKVQSIKKSKVQSNISSKEVDTTKLTPAKVSYNEIC